MYQTKVNLLTKLMYIAAAISIPLISGRLWMFGVFIAVSLLVLASGKILKKTVPLIFPVVMRFLINTRERAIALEVRGFGAGKKKTWLAERTPHKGDRAVTILLGLCILAAVVWRIVGCL